MRVGTGLFVVGLLAVDAVVLAAVGTRPGVPDVQASRAPAAFPGDDGWALCQTSYNGREVTPTSVALTYLDQDLDTGVTVADLHSWFGPLDLGAVDVYALQHKRGTRRVAFILERGKWPRWDEVVGSATGQTVCDRVRAALLEAGIRRPAGPGADGEPRSRYDYELIYARRAQLYDVVQWLGTVADIGTDEDLQPVLEWLDPPPQAPEPTPSEALPADPFARPPGDPGVDLDADEPPGGPDDAADDVIDPWGAP